MSNKVGPKGQIVIEKAIRERLGVEQGYVAVQTVVDDHIEIRFYPGEHNRSLLGILARPGQPILTDEELSVAGEQAWMQAVKTDWLESEASAPEANQ
jgi:AbrB family looped-hinge helix DNA binding protein